MPNKIKLIAVAALMLFLAFRFCVAEEDNNWEEYYFGPVTEGGIVAENKEGFILSFDKIGAFGIYNTKRLIGNFDVQAEIKSATGICGIILFKNAQDKPDLANFVGIERRINKEGKKIVRVFAVKEGQDFVRRNSLGEEKFEFSLDNDSSGYDAKALRILRDEKGGCLHFYYKYKRNVDGKGLEGWVEFSTLPDLDKRSFYLYTYVKSDGQIHSKAIFNRPMAISTAADDKPNSDTGFKAVRRDYTFSGSSGDAVVVTFGKESLFCDKAKFVFWSETNYIPWWQIDDKCAVRYGSCKIWETETQTCYDPSVDRLLRWSQVDIVESNKARVIVHWQYVLADQEYKWLGLDPAERPMVDEWYCFYPDGTGVRRVIYTPVLTGKYEIDRSEISELSVVKRGGTKLSELINPKAISIFDLSDRNIYYLWDLKKSVIPAKMNPDVDNWPEAICRVNLRNRPAVFEVFTQGADTYRKPSPDPSDSWLGYYEESGKADNRYIREPGYIRLLPVPGQQITKEKMALAMLIGLSKPLDDQDLREKTSSWLSPGDINMIGNKARFIENDHFHRALVFEADKADRGCNFTMDPKAVSSVVVNPVFVIKNWGNHPVSIKMNGKQLKDTFDYRYDIVDDAAVIWVKAKFYNPTTFLIN